MPMMLLVAAVVVTAAEPPVPVLGVLIVMDGALVYPMPAFVSVMLPIR
jgi:hypothetical protein